MSLLTRFRQRESGLLTPVEEAQEKASPSHLEQIAEEALAGLAPLETVDALMRARVIRDQQLSQLAQLRRSDLAALETRYKTLKRRVWDEYRQAEATANAMRAAKA